MFENISREELIFYIRLAFRKAHALAQRLFVGNRIYFNVAQEEGARDQFQYTLLSGGHRKKDLK